jgi:eukaryotic-like serine/threonine-protein kinase
VPDGRLLAGRYQLEVALGRGASGQVWRARDVTMRRPVAVKIVALGEIADAPLLAETIGRFRREAMSVSQLRHPNIVAAFDAGRVANELFLAMELADGASLARVLEQRTAAGIGLLPIASVLDIAEQVCAGLGAAHAAGVVHRDIKPSNIIVTPRLQVKIIDFGVARLLTDKSPRLTLPSQQIGTLLYVSPEQAAGEDVDGRADLYSLGCVLYELLAGEPPFMAEVPAALLRMQLHDEPVPLLTRRADVPPGLDRLVADLMAKDRAQRPADAQLVIARIKVIRAGLGGIEAAQDADRSTVNAGDQADASKPAATSVAASEPPPGRAGTALTVAAGGRADPEAAPATEAARTTVLTPETLAELTIAPQSAAAAGSSTTAGPITAGPITAGPITAGPVTAGPVTAGPVTAGPVTARPVTARPVTSWPTPQRRRPRRRRWRAAASTLVTAVILGAVAVVLWQRSHDQLKVTAVTVAPAQLPGSRCNVTVDVVGRIATNGRGGPISYQWVRNGGLRSPVTAVTAGTGQDLVRVRLQWTFDGQGAESATAELRVLTPERAAASTAFTYTCTS